MELNTIDKKEILDEIRKHFAEITTEQFVENLKQVAPFLWDESILSPDDFSHAVKKQKPDEKSHKDL